MLHAIIGFLSLNIKSFDIGIFLQMECIQIRKIFGNWRLIFGMLSSRLNSGIFKASMVLSNFNSVVRIARLEQKFDVRLNARLEQIT